ncbi:unnamed protein product, partial [Mesorhabditis belari]|uniref:Uncharacterized protein n=1 Tax=Mesorhabditis belari TaxID=2138241 RepID=A0AAF3F5C1_9BILA
MVKSALFRWIQIFGQISFFGDTSPYWLSRFLLCFAICGLDLKAQEAALRLGPDIVVATPGRLLDHLHNAPSFTLSTIEVLVLDEADRMLEQAFEEQMKEIIRLCATKRQTLLFSATMTDQIEHLASMSLKKPVKIFINENTETANKLRQEFIRIRGAREGDREAIVSAMVTRTFQEQTIVFVKTKKDCQRMQILLGLLGVKVGQMHSSLTQAQRVEALAKFKRRELDVLVSTDLAARGLDIEGIQTVVNMHMPSNVKQYIHRVGRTARAGKSGRSISLIGEDDRKLFKEILVNNQDKVLKQRVVSPEVVEAYNNRISDLEESIQKIEEDEKAERSMRIAEEEMKRTEERLEKGKTERDGRKWIKEPTDAEKLRKREENRKLKLLELKKKKTEKTTEEKDLERVQAFQARSAKRARRGKRMRAVEEDEHKKGGRSAQRGNKRGKKSNFTLALAGISKQGVKAARAGPDDAGFRSAKRTHMREMGILGVAAAVLIVSTILYFFLKHLKIRDQLKGLPGPRSFPIIGQALVIKPDAEGFMDQVMGMSHLYPDNPRMVLFWIGPNPALMIYSAQLAEPILSSSKHLNKGFAYNLLHPWLGLSLLTSDAERWRPKRKLLTPTFHYDILKDFVPVFNYHAMILVKKLAEVKENEVINFDSYVTLCALDIICETSMGRRVNAQLEANSSYVKAVYRINDIVQNRTKNPLMWNKWIFDRFGEGKVHDECLEVLHGFTQKVIAQRKIELEKAEWHFTGRLAFLDLLLDMARQDQIGHDDIQPEVDTFMFEGHDTTSTGLAWASHLLGNNPEIMKKAQEEVDRIITDFGEIGAEALSELKYLDCCVKETLRLYPSVPAIMRELGDDQMIGGFKIPSGTHIIINPYLIHRDPAQWPEPERFNPERFFPENMKGRHAFSLIPFSAGSRNCIGQRFAYMEMKTVLAWMLYYFDIESVDRRCDVSHKMELILRPAEGIRLRLKQRRPMPA